MSQTPGSPGIGLPPGLLSRIFPFHVAVDRDLTVLQVGESLRRVCPKLVPGAPLDTQVRIERPHVPCRFEAIVARAHEVFVLDAGGGRLRLRGQMLRLEEPEALVFIGSPWVLDAQELQAAGLSLSDLAVHESTVDLLMLLQTQRAALDDARRVSDRLDRQRAQLRRTNRSLTIQYRVAQLLASGDPLADSAQALLASAAEAVDGHCAALWTVDVPAGALSCFALWHGADGDLDGFVSATRTARFPLGTGLPGRVWADRRPHWIEDVRHDPNFPRAAQAEAAGIRGGFAVPVMIRETVVAVLEVFRRTEGRPDAEILEILTALGMQLGQVVGREQTAAAAAVGTQALAAREAQLRAVLTGAVDGIITIDALGIVETINPAAERIFGYPLQEIVGRNVSMLMPEPDASAHDTYIRRHVDTGESRIIGIGREVQGRRRDGSLFPMDLAVSSVGTGEARRFIGIVRDITERKRAEAELLATSEALAASEARVRLVIDTALDAVISMDADGRITEWSAQAERIFGWPREEAIGRSLESTIVPPALRERHRRGLRHYLATGEGPALNRRVELTALRRDGQEFPVELAIAPIVSGPTVTFSAFVRDITDRHRAEQALRASEERYRHLVELSMLGVYIHSDGIIRFANPAMASIHGYRDPAELVGQPYWIVLPPEERDRIEEYRRARLGGGPPHGEGIPTVYETLNIRQDGTKIWVENSATVIPWEGSRAVMVTFLDITERKRAQEALTTSKAELEDRLRDTSALLGVAEAVGGTLELTEALRRICQAIARLTGADTVAAYLIDERTRVLRPAAGYRVPPEMLEVLGETVIPLGPGGFREELLREGMLWSDNVLEDPRFDLQLVRHTPHHSAGIIPLVLDGQVSGGFYMAWWEARGPLEPAMRHLLETIGQQVGVLLRNARLFQAAEERTTRLRTLTRLNGLISSSLDVDTVLREISQAAVQFTGARIATFWIVDETSRTLELRVHSDPALHASQIGRRARFGEGSPGWVAEHRRPLIADDAFADGRIVDLDRLRALGLRSVCSLPVMLEDRLLAVLCLYGREPLAFGPDDWRHLESFAAQAGLAVRNASLYAETVAARDAAEAATRAKSDFLSTMSHEIRTPLNGVIGMIQLMLQDELAPIQYDRAEILRHSADTLLALIDDILDLAKIESGQLALQVADLDPRDIVEGVAELFAPQAAAKQVDLTAVIDPALPQRLRGDALRLRQVLGNLMANAVKFTDQGHITVRVSAAPHNGAWRLRTEVTDTGIGISPENQARLFHPFTQADLGATKRRGGTGLGLAILKRLVELMQGEIGLESRPGHGSLFWFTARLEPAEISPPIDAREELRGVRTLIVDANPRRREALQCQARALELDVSDMAEAGEVLSQLRLAARANRPFRVLLVAGPPGEGDGDLAAAIAQDPALGELHTIRLWTPGAGRVREETTPREAILPSLVRSTILRERLVRLLRGSTVESPRPTGSKWSLGLHVLVAEDNRTNQKVAAMVLASLGCRPEVVDNGRQAVDAVAKGGYDLVLMDCWMPEMDGLEATRAIRRTETPPRRIPIVAMTANVLPGERERCLDAGMDEYLTKPLVVDVLATTLARLSSPAGEASAVGTRPAPQAPAPPTLDPARLAGLRNTLGETGNDVVEAIIAVFLDEGPALLQSLRRAVAQGDLARLERDAHSLKGASANIGAGELEALAAALEARARRREAADLDAEVTRLETAFVRAQAALEIARGGGRTS